MLLRRVTLKNFRNYEDLDVELSPGLNIMHGDNAQGKTSFVEAIYVCATGRSQRTSNIRELIMISKPDAHVRVTISGDIPDTVGGSSNGSQNNDSGDMRSFYDRIDVHLRRDDGRGVALNGLPIKKIGELFGTLLAVIFSPEDLGLIKSGPGERRRFMDIELCQLSILYYNELRLYCQALKQRNNLLKSAKANRDLIESIFIWDEQLINHGLKIMKSRAGFIEEMAIASAAIHADISKTERLQLTYRPCVTAGEYAERLKKGIERDIISGTTNIGIHRDDIIFTVNGSDLRFYGSQGQQRTACLSLKLAEIELVVNHKRKKPVLLLDDVLSELDDSRQKYLIGRALDTQTIITCAGGIREDLSQGAGAVFKVEAGRVVQERKIARGY